MSSLTKRCWVPNCTNSKSKIVLKSSTKLFGFPRNVKRCREWLRAIGDPDLAKCTYTKLTHYRYVCMDHFLYKHITATRRTAENAVPVIFTEPRPPLTEEELREFDSSIPVERRDHFTMMKETPLVMEVSEGAEVASAAPDYGFPQVPQDSSPVVAIFEETEVASAIPDYGFPQVPLKSPPIVGTYEEAEVASVSPDYGFPQVPQDSSVVAICEETDVASVAPDYGFPQVPHESPSVVAIYEEAEVASASPDYGVSRTNTDIAGDEMISQNEHSDNTNENDEIAEVGDYQQQQEIVETLNIISTPMNANKVTKIPLSNRRKRKANISVQASEALTEGTKAWKRAVEQETVQLIRIREEEHVFKKKEHELRMQVLSAKLLAQNAKLDYYKLMKERAIKEH